MDNEKLLNMDPYIILSWINTKLRDEFESLEALCSDYGLRCDAVIDRLKTIGYCYCQEKNQFKVFCN